MDKLTRKQLQRERDFLFDMAVGLDAHRLCDSNAKIVFKEQYPRSKKHVEWLIETLHRNG